ncbi:MAG TPA: outer membrane lipoprotein carrier protein LolA [Alphaproteobacteria bacterium]|nr:outer membrane lipoprotein carrier protein LolA [Alphaproteobacteria bacterium]
MRIVLLALLLILPALTARAADPNYAQESAASVTATKQAAEVAAKALAAHKPPPGYNAAMAMKPLPAPVDVPPAPEPIAAPTPPPDTEAEVLPAPDLTPQDRADIKRIQLYLNQLKSIKADFMQIDDHGGTMRGIIDIERPGRMRVTYAKPSGDFIVADGDFVHIWNADLQSQTNVPERASLADFILRDPIVLSGDVTITKFERKSSKMELTLTESKDPGAGSLTLVFEDHPLILRQWRVIDAEGHTTGVNLTDEQAGVDFPDSTFNFVPPTFGRGLHTETVP